ncbi:chorismate synthase [Allofrancisella guangzhouensis]|uniref:Chorismate synthase n=1 Tax=Allofrancisella guangzhouensis TaxID=594679 RepID=A0A0A8E676_9GAMM|nr:chorismate synthase [Allofrancisella guangzhouensis]AJC49508.1 chorismate synthase [Allofrancisella guangzhouensis]MBK2027035.1 chorismate synthase [Allofrancisella guangzhouensis]MBK2044525.1 chorismate synthase [Allofrancisella guangzhouensis]MBK2046143.1 chorismate synthase [Allofrancisella guangzhouensis]
MSGNTFGKIFTVTTCGESHGDSLIAIIDGCPANIELSEADIQPDLDRRKPGQSKFTTQRKESDEVKIISGVFEGKTTGTPIGLVIKNQDQKSKDYEEIKDKFRPGHADYTYFKKYGLRDYRGGGRSSARETAMRVAAGAIAKKILKQHNIEIYAFCSQIGNLKIDFKDKSFINQNPFFIADIDAQIKCEELIHQIRKEGDSVGAEVTVVATGVQAGFGRPIFDRLDANIAHALMSINAVKAVSIGDGFDCVTQKGSQHRDEISQEQGFLSNHAGGILGGISTGQDIISKLAFKPTSSILKPGKSIDINGQDTTVITKGRHDPCVGIRGVPIAEAMLALVLADELLLTNAYKR